jgi:hypothetical protein
VVDGSGLENRHTRKGIGGSNPSLSAIFLNPNHLRRISFLLDRPVGSLFLTFWCPVDVLNRGTAVGMLFSNFSIAC